MENPGRVSGVFTLYDDESVREKLTVMNKLGALVDDGRNPDIGEEVDFLLQVGKSYRITIEEVTVNDEWAPKLGDPVVTLGAVWRSDPVYGSLVDRLEILFMNYLAGDGERVALIDDRGRVLIRNRWLVFEEIDDAEKFIEGASVYEFATKWGLSSD